MQQHPVTPAQQTRLVRRAPDARSRRWGRWRRQGWASWTRRRARDTRLRWRRRGKGWCRSYYHGIGMGGGMLIAACRVWEACFVEYIVMKKLELRGDVWGGMGWAYPGVAEAVNDAFYCLPSPCHLVPISLQFINDLLHVGVKRPHESSGIFWSSWYSFTSGLWLGSA